MKKIRSFIFISLVLVLIFILLICSFNYFKFRKVYSFISSQTNQSTFNMVSEKSSFTIKENKKLKTIYYKNTVSENPVTNYDGYGSYDIYTDENKTEYWFLHNSNIFCGFRNTVTIKDINNSKNINYNSAINTAKKFCSQHIYKFNEYVYDCYFYDPNISSYCIRFYKPIDNCKTDDNINICVSDTGNIQGFSAYNCGRYDNLSFDTSIVNRLMFPDKNQLATSLKNNNFDVTNSYISRDNYGDLNIVYTINSNTHISYISYPITTYQ